MLLVLVERFLCPRFAAAWEAVDKVQGVIYAGWQEPGWPQSGKPGCTCPSSCRGDSDINPALGGGTSFGASSQTEIRARSKARGMMKVWGRSPFGGRHDLQGEQRGLPVLSLGEAPVVLRAPQRSWPRTRGPSHARGWLLGTAHRPVLPCAPLLAALRWVVFVTRQFSHAM